MIAVDFFSILPFSAFSTSFAWQNDGGNISDTLFSDWNALFTDISLYLHADSNGDIKLAPSRAEIQMNYICEGYPGKLKKSIYEIALILSFHN